MGFFSNTLLHVACIEVMYQPALSPLPLTLNTHAVIVNPDIYLPVAQLLINGTLVTTISLLVDIVSYLNVFQFIYLVLVPTLSLTHYLNYKILIVYYQYLYRYSRYFLSFSLSFSHFIYILYIYIYIYIYIYNYLYFLPLLRNKLTSILDLPSNFATFDCRSVSHTITTLPSP